MRVTGGKIVRNLGNTYGGKWQFHAPAAFPLETEPAVTTEGRSGWASDCLDTSCERQFGGPQTVWTLHMHDKSHATVENRNMFPRVLRQ